MQSQIVFTIHPCAWEHSKTDPSPTGTRTPVVRVKAEYPDQLDYRGVMSEQAKKNLFIPKLKGLPEPVRGGGTSSTQNS